MYNIIVMAKHYSKRTTKRTTKKLTYFEARDIIVNEFTDSRGNKVVYRFDFNPHSIDEPTIQTSFVGGKGRSRINLDFRPHPINEPTIQVQRRYGE